MNISTKGPRSTRILAGLLALTLVLSAISVTLPHKAAALTPGETDPSTGALYMGAGDPFTNGTFAYFADLGNGLAHLSTWMGPLGGGPISIVSSSSNVSAPSVDINQKIAGNVPGVSGSWTYSGAAQYAGGNVPNLSGNGTLWGLSDFQMTSAGTLTLAGVPLPSSLLLAHCIQEAYATSADGSTMQMYADVQSADYNSSTGIYIIGIRLTGWNQQNSHQQAVSSRDIVRLEWINGGRLKVRKSSDDPSITDNNDCYHLAGARYGIYASAADAQADARRLATLTTDESGSTPATGVLVPGVRYVRELAAPPGYLLDDTISAVMISAGQTVTFTTVDQPAGDPAPGYVYKVDRETGAQAPQGSASLAEAQFTVAYYDGFYANATAAEASGAPLRTWVFQTNAQGVFSPVDRTSLVSGDALFQDRSANVVLPLGTYVTCETKASPGYLLPDDPAMFVTRVVTDDASPGGTRQEGDCFGLSQAEIGDSATLQREQVIRGDLEIAKICDATSAPVETGLAGIQFTLTEQTSNTICTITTNDAGFATTRALLPKGSDLAGALPYGTWLVHEVAATVPTGLRAVPDFTVTITKNAQLEQFILNDAQVKAAIKIVKTDATTGKTVTASAMTFQILDESGAVVSFTRHSPEVETVTQFTTNEHGVFTLPQQLAWGIYYIHELDAPTGYVKSPDQIFSVTGDAPFDAPLVVEFADRPQMAEVTAIKLDLRSQAPLTGAVYGVFATEDITTADGTLRAARGDLVDTISIESTTTPVPSGPLFCGDYELRELVAPEGYLLDTDSHPVKLTSDSAVTTVTAQTIVQDDYTKLRISKTDLVSGVDISEAELALARSDGSIVATWTTDGTPREIDQLEPGDYVLRETTAPEGYLISEEVAFTVQATGEVQKVVMKDDYTKLDISKQDATTGKELPGAHLVVKDLAGRMIDQWVSTDTVHRIEHLAPGAYTLTETIAPNGYQIAQTVSFSVSATAEVQRVTMKDAHAVTASLPQTGDRLRVSGILLAVLIACGGAGMLVVTQMQRRKEGLQ